jgi:hypothetical protein
VIGEWSLNDGHDLSIPDISPTIKARTRPTKKYGEPKQPLPPLKRAEELQQDELYLPLEMFSDSTSKRNPIEELLNGPVAYSCSQDLDGTNYSSWCNVIEWDRTQKRTQVASFNLRFENEDPESSEKRIEAFARTIRC